jgi:hypothetical protein
MNIGSCFICGDKAQYAYFFDTVIGHFVVGGEPRVCAICNDKLESKTDDERRKLFADFEVTEMAPNDSGDVLGDTRARSDAFKRRGQA